MSFLNTPASPDNNAIRELRDGMNELNETIKKEIKETSKYSDAFVFLACVQIIVALWQFVLDVTTSNHQLIGTISSVCLLISVVIFTRSFDFLKKK